MYGKALRTMREVKFPHMEATTRNNLARVLSDRGYGRGRRLCLDALELRKQQGASIPIAYSYNTMALIDNIHMRPDLAWIESAIAIAYFRLAEESRGLGLALLQLSEALRRLATRKSEIYHLRGDLPEVVMETAEQAINEAVELFTSGKPAGEIERRIEAWIEKGCVERDFIRFSDENPEQKQRHYRDCLYYLDKAAKLAKRKENLRLELDARVNIAWSHYSIGKFKLARESLDESEKIIPPECLFRQEMPAPSAQRDDIFVYKQLSKINGLRGRMALEEFNQSVEKIKETYTDREMRNKAVEQDDSAQTSLRDAAKYYVLALNYAQLLSPRSSALTIIYDSIYDYVKMFNLFEIETFYKYVQNTQQEFYAKTITLRNLGKLDDFITHTFGCFGEEPSDE
jgi:tetratricopeptide (TPR) repeat protein